jgi:hypothetical protein
MKIDQANKDVAIHETNTSHVQFFYTHKLQKSDDIDIKQIRSIDNLVNYDIQEDCSYYWHASRIFSLTIEDLCIHEGE